MVFEKVRKILSEQLEIDEDKITMQSNLAEDLKADSLDIVELIMELETEFSIEIPDDDLPKVTHVSDIVNYLESKLAK